ncbi:MULTISPECIES: amino acid ABC transporter permease [Ramlibacter]|uniref:Amino acid ABC transporter permease n=1 Tax=Ramlibacter aquaticus TaxID=2780094 RepID=A0ABR9SGX7_9BURK|nr:MULTISPECIES: amino acid ABC transporter permease [Ramlibacter]MBE7941604.1 amino acid ABC transporter permease [Ramlibacter aquaticus]
MSGAAGFVAARPRPAAPAAGLLQRARRELFGDALTGATTIVLALLLAWAGWHFLQWALVHAVWQPDATRCQAARGQGACWGVVAEKGGLIVFGRYPADQRWRAALASLLLVATVGASGAPWLRRPLRLAAAWLLVLAAFLWLMGGGAGLAHVPTDLWGGLPLTLLLTGTALALAFPLAVALALGRRSRLPALRAVCSAFVELVRGVPLVSVLFMASFMAPLLLPPGRTPDVLLRVVAGLTLFAAAYMAEIVRAGLQSVERGQAEAAASLGLSWWQAQRGIVLPQALAAVVPALVNNILSLFKDTSLVTIVSLYELTGALGLALSSDADWRPFQVEASLFVAAIYFSGCFALSRMSLALERRLGRGRAR